MAARKARTSAGSKPKRELIIQKHGNTMFYEFAWDGGGRVPDALQGVFTTPVEAEKIRQSYLKENSNG